MGPSLPFPNIRGPRRQVFVVEVETSGVPNDRSFPRSSPETETNPFFEFISQSIGATRAAVSVRFSALGGMFLRRPSRAQDPLIPTHDFNRRIFSAPGTSYKCGLHSELSFPTFALIVV